MFRARLVPVSPALFLLAAICAPPALGQTTPDLEQGIKSYGNYTTSDIDDVSLVNGRLYVHIPIVSYPQRGGKLRLDYTLRYLTPILQLRQTCPPHLNCFYTAWLTGPNGGFSNLDISRYETTYTNQNGQLSPYNYWTATLPDGSSHILGMTGTNTYESVDATGLHYDSNADVLTDADGIRYAFVQGGLNVEDTNGNKISVAGSTTDTLGRTIPSEAGVATSDYSGCTGPLPVSSAHTWTLPSPQGGNATFKFCYATVALNYNLPQTTKWSTGNPSTLLQSLLLPNGTTWIFQYDPTYAALSTITFPSGGTISYTWNLIQPCGAPGYPINYAFEVATRTVNANDGTGPHTWTYSWGSPVKVTDPLGNDTLHTMTGLRGTCGIYETQTQYFQGSSTTGTLLKTVATDYTYSYNPETNYNANYTTAVNVVPIRITTTWPASNLVTKVETDYDSGFSYTGIFNSSSATYGKVIAKREYDYGNGSPGPLLRQTKTNYLAFSNSSYLTNNLLEDVSSQQVLDGGGVQRAYTTFGYDEYALANAGAVTTQHDSNPPAGSSRGNLTSIHRWLNGTTTTTTNCTISVSNGYLVSYNVFNDTGTVDHSVDSCGTSASDANHKTSFAYSLTYAGAYPTTITNALGQSTSKTYDFNTGLLSSTTDPNNLTTTPSYDSMLRLTQVAHPDNGLESISRQESSFPLTSTLTTKINSSQSKTQTNVFDGLARISQTQLTSHPQGTVYTDTTFDALGRVATVSNPYRNGNDPTTTTGTTTFGHDAISRKTSETYPDGSVLTTAYCGPSTLVTGPTGRWRRSRVDALGRLVEVDEPNAPGATVNANGCPGTGEPIWVTSYSYDALGNLTQVVQNGSHQRSFTYDSLSHLLTSTNPEVGTITYAYDADGNVATKTDARSIKTTYSYDLLNRLLGTTYSNADPSINYRYDESNCLGLSACQNIGHRTSMTDAAGSESWAYQVDSANSRSIHKEQRITGGITKSSTYYLDLAGNVTQVVYPTGRVVNYTYSAANRPITATDGSNGISYATDFQTVPTGCLSGAVCYTPQGTFYAFSIGQSSGFTGLNLTHTYNNRLQPNEFKVSSSGGNAIDITYNFVDPATGKNAGIVYGITNNLDTSRSQTFTYDQLNRITSALTTSTHATSPSHCWGETYALDAWGNLNSIAATTNSNYTGCTAESGFSTTADGNNHLPVWAYDASGNATSDSVVTNYQWDAESQLKSAAGVSYTYDGDGRRVSKVGSKLYWYGSGGDILAETDASGNTTAEYIFFGGKRIAMLPAGGNPIYYIEDMLGTSRVLTTNTGVVCYDADFYPYGGERSYTNTCPQNYKFEGKERDTETGNDEFGARYYSNRFGRWLSADWSSVPVPVPYANLTNPQTLNLYSMVADDPESFADLDGHIIGDSEQALVGGGAVPGSNSMLAQLENQMEAEFYQRAEEENAAAADAAQAPQTPANATQPQAQNQNPDQPPGENQPSQPQQPQANQKPSAAAQQQNQDQNQQNQPIQMSGGKGGGQQPKGERRITRKPEFKDKPGKLPKGVRENPDKPGEYQVRNSHTGNWENKSKGWSPYAQKVGIVAAIVTGAVIVGRAIAGCFASGLCEAAAF